MLPLPLLLLTSLSLHSANAAPLNRRQSSGPSFTAPVQIRSEDDTRSGWIVPEVGGGSGVSMMDFSTYDAFDEDSFFGITLSGTTYSIAPLAAEGSSLVAGTTAGSAFTVGGTEAEGSSFYITCESAGVNSGDNCLIQSAYVDGQCATLGAYSAGVGTIAAGACNATSPPYWSFNVNASSDATPSSTGVYSSSTGITSTPVVIGGTTTTAVVGGTTTTEVIGGTTAVTSSPSSSPTSALGSSTMAIVGVSTTTLVAGGATSTAASGSTSSAKSSSASASASTTAAKSSVARQGSGAIWGASGALAVAVAVLLL